MPLFLKLKKLWNVLVFPKGYELIFLTVIVGIYMFSAAFVLNGDGSYGYAMIQRMNDPQAFADNDLPIIGGLKGNFLFYKTLNYLPFFQQNFVLVDFLISTVLAALLILAWYNVLMHLTKDKKLTLLVMFFILFVDGRLSLGGTTLPLFYLISITSVHWLQIFALLFFFKKNYLLSFILLTLTTYFHPSAGIFFLCVLGVVLFLETLKTRQYNRLVVCALVSIIIFIPNYFLLKGGISQVEDISRFFVIHHNLSGPNGGHIYIESYPFAFAYTLSVFILFLLARKKNKINSSDIEINEAQNTMSRIIFVSLALVGVWLVDVYFFKHLQVFYLYFGNRSTYLLKPLLILVLSSLAYQEFKSKNLSGMVIGFLLMVSLILPHVYVGAAMLWIVILYYGLGCEQWKFVKTVNEYWRNKELLFGLNKTKVVLVFTIVLFVTTVGMFAYKYNNKLYKLYRLAHGENIFNFSFNKEKNYGLNKANPEFGQVLDWAKASYKGKMFITPPEDCHFSGPFRFLTKNSIYINICDALQMPYEPAEFYEGYERMEKLGVKFGGWGKIDYTGFYTMKVQDFSKLEADFVIFDKTSVGYAPQPEKPVFENKQYIIYSLR